jgi:hypothetical protein
LTRLVLALAVALARAVVVALAVRDLRADDVPDGPIRVPRVIGMRNPIAEEVLVRSKLRWRFEGSDRVRARPTHGRNVSVVPFDSDYVIAQEPNAGEMVPRGWVVVLDTECLTIGRQGDRACI